MRGDLADWLRAELDRVEQLARAAAEPDGPEWTHNPGDHWLISGESGHPLVYDEGTPTDAQAQHIALWDPAAVLRRVAADRQILAEHTNDGYGECIRCADEGRDAEIGGGFIETLRDALPWPCRTIRLLAEGYGWPQEPARPIDEREAYEAARTAAVRSLRSEQEAAAEADGFGAPLRRATTSLLLTILDRPSPFDLHAPIVRVAPGTCRETSFGWIHVKPSCRCPQDGSAR